MSCRVDVFLCSFLTYTHCTTWFMVLRFASPRRLMAESQIKQRNTLKAIVAFAELSPDAIERIERRCAWKHYSPGEPILDYLDKSDDVFFLALGEVRVTIYSTAGKAVSFRELG